MQNDDINRRFPDGLLPHEKSILFEILDSLLPILNEIDWILYGGSHMGSLLVEDLLPWDDDIDILVYDFPLDVPVERFSTALVPYGRERNLPMLKVFDPDIPSIPGKNYSFPFVDISMMHNMKGEIVHLNTEWGVDRYPAEWVLPAADAQLNGRAVKVPASTRVLETKYSKDWAISSPPLAWSHREERFTHFDRKRVPLTELLLKKPLRYPASPKSQSGPPSQ